MFFNLSPHVRETRSFWILLNRLKLCLKCFHVFRVSHFQADAFSCDWGWRWCSLSLALQYFFRGPILYIFNLLILEWSIQTLGSPVAHRFHFLSLCIRRTLFSKLSQYPMFQAIWGALLYWGGILPCLPAYAFDTLEFWSPYIITFSMHFASKFLLHVP